MSKTAKRGPGRPPKPEGAKFGTVTVRLPEKMIHDIDEFCAQRRDEPDRSKAIRELIARGLDA